MGKLISLSKKERDFIISMLKIDIENAKNKINTITNLINKLRDETTL